MTGIFRNHGVQGKEARVEPRAGQLLRLADELASEEARLKAAEAEVQAAEQRRRGLERAVGQAASAADRETLSRELADACAATRMPAAKCEDARAGRDRAAKALDAARQRADWLRSAVAEHTRVLDKMRRQRADLDAEHARRVAAADEALAEAEARRDRLREGLADLVGEG